MVENEYKEPETMDDDEIVQVVLEYRKEGFKGREERLRKNEENRAIYMGDFDFSDKIAGQSTETLPKTSTAIEQFSAFTKRSLVQFGDYFSMDLDDDEPPITASVAERILKNQLEHLPLDEFNDWSFPTLVSDAVKIALNESVMIFKVYGRKHKKRRRFVEKGEIKEEDIEPWRLHIDLIRSEDYFCDPSGRGLYEGHEIERDLHEVQEMADRGVYDKDVVDRIKEDFTRQEEAKKRDEQNQGEEITPPSFRKRVKITELWGTLLDRDGAIVHSNCLVTIANDKYVIRKPRLNPWWHGESPFEKIPLLRVPFSIYHKALMDSAVPLNIALTDLFNLILDGGLASVWGIKQIRTDWLDDPSQVADGIPQGATLGVNTMAPPNAKVIEQVTEGQIPPDAMALYNLLDREFNSAALTNDVKMGLLPPKQVKATEIVEAQQSSSVIMDGIASDVEEGLERVLHKAWLVMLQSAGDMMVSSVSRGVSDKDLMILARMKEDERFSKLGENSVFKVNGLSGTLSRVREFQKLTTLIQTIGANPLLMAAFAKKYNASKLVAYMMKMLNIDPTDIEYTEDDLKQDQGTAVGVSQAPNTEQPTPIFPGFENAS